MATWGDQTCQRFEAIAVGFETGFSRLRDRPSNQYAIAPHMSASSEHFKPGIHVTTRLVYDNVLSRRRVCRVVYALSRRDAFVEDSFESSFYRVVEYQTCLMLKISTRR